MSNPGTPRDLREALAQAKASALYAHRPEVDVLYDAVRDRLAQTFSRFTLNENPLIAETASEIWNAIFPGEVKS